MSHCLTVFLAGWLTRGEGGEILPSNGLLGMCRWMGSHFLDWTDYNGVTFSDIFNRVTRMGLQRKRLPKSDQGGSQKVATK